MACADGTKEQPCYIGDDDDDDVQFLGTTPSRVIPVIEILDDNKTGEREAAILPVTNRQRQRRPVFPVPRKQASDKARNTPSRPLDNTTASRRHGSQETEDAAQRQTPRNFVDLTVEVVRRATRRISYSQSQPSKVERTPIVSFTSEILDHDRTDSILNDADDLPLRSDADDLPSGPSRFNATQAPQHATGNSQRVSESPTVTVDNQAFIQPLHIAVNGDTSVGDQAEESPAQIGKRTVQESEPGSRFTASEDATNQDVGIAEEQRDGTHSQQATIRQRRSVEETASTHTVVASVLNRPCGRGLLPPPETAVISTTDASSNHTVQKILEVRNSKNSSVQKLSMSMFARRSEEVTRSATRSTSQSENKGDQRVPSHKKSALNPAGTSPSKLSLPKSATALPLTESSVSRPTVEVMGQNRKTQSASNNLRLDATSKCLLTFDLTSGDIIAVRREIQALFKQRLERVYEHRAYATKQSLQQQRLCFERDLRLEQLGVKRQTKLPEKYVQHRSPFEALTSIQVHSTSDAEFGLKRDISQEVFTKANSRNARASSNWSIPATAQSFPATPFPPTKEYLTSTRNILAENVSRLTTMPPDVADNKTQEQLREDMPQLYEIRHDTNSSWDLRNAQCQFYMTEVSDFLHDIGISWESILFFLLAKDTQLQRINNGVEGFGNRAYEDMLLDDRKRYKRDDTRRGKDLTLFKHASKHWQEFLKRLVEPNAIELRLGGLVCATLLNECGFSPWYMAQQSDVAKKYLLEFTSEQPKRCSNFRTVICRVCHEHDCISHGQIRQYPTSDTDSDSGDDAEIVQNVRRQRRAAVGPEEITQSRSSVNNDTPPPGEGVRPGHMHEDEDLGIEHVISYKLLANPDAFKGRELAQESEGKSPPDGEFAPKFWLDCTNTIHHSIRKPFFPCDHDGPCSIAQCRCYREGTTCEKTCRCEKSCNRRFPGCRCASKENRIQSCRTEDSCLCAKFNRECDADLCGTCGAVDILDPTNRYNEKILEGRCGNVGIQRGVRKKTLLGQSEVHGFGLYTGQDIAQNEIIAEYTGEITNREEETRRSYIHDAQKIMYWYELNAEQQIDSTFTGNKTRFINNADEELANCYPKTLFCNGVFRAALYAKYDLKPGTELFFYYNYPKPKTKDFKQPKGAVFAAKTVIRSKGGTKSRAENIRTTKDNKRSVSSASSQSIGRSRAQRARDRESRSMLRTTRSRTSSSRGLARNMTDHEGQDEPSGSEDDVDDESSGSEDAIDDEPQGRNDTQETASSYVVQETDEEDNSELQSDEEQEMQDEPEPVRKEASFLNAGIGPKRAIKSSSVVAFKAKRPRLRNGLARKQKRLSLIDSDEE